MMTLNRNGKKAGRGRLAGMILAMLLTAPLGALAALEDGGTNSPFDLGAGSRALALGRSYVAVADDVSALFWNPAGLSQLDQIEVSAMHIDLYFGTPYDFIGVAYPLLDWGTFALGAVRVATDGIVLRDDRSRVLGNGDGSVDMRQYLLGYSREITVGLRAGLVVKIDQIRLLGDFDAGVGLDLGFHYRLPEDPMGIGGIPWNNLTLGLSVQNVIGSRLRLAEVEDVIPLGFKTGLAYRHDTEDSMQQHFLITGTWERSTWRASRFAGGVEYGLLDLFRLRGGLNYDGWSVGGGLHYVGIMLDYALASEALGITHRFTLSYRFGVPVSEQRAARERQREEELDREAQRRAQEAVEETSRAMEQIMKNSERRHSREKKAMLAKRQQLLRQERRRLTEQRQAALADEYFKALHYFQGIEDYLARNYKQAVVEFETVEKYDPNYLQLQVYLQRARQRAGGQTKVMSDKSYQRYYHGIDFYVTDEFDKAITVWKKILVEEPNNVLVLRNIEEAEGRMARLKAIREEIAREEHGQAPGGTKAQPSQPKKK